jgi:hypothetical protein
MSRPQKIHPPIKLGFDGVLGAVATGKGKAKRVAPKPKTPKPPEKK